jgi:threonine aldolase
MIDLRSDTVTTPTEGMWGAMHKAPVGDDVFGEDPGLNALEKKVSDLFGLESGVFVPSGTMGNQLGLKVHTQPADEVIIDENAHIFHSEGAAGSLISGIQLRPLQGTRGLLNREIVRQAIRPRNDWDPHTRVVALENTSNKGGGTCYPLHVIREIYDLTREHGLALHLDGARIWNAAVSTGTDLRAYGSICDTISVCFSKGLGAPVGSMLLGNEEDMKKARRFRKILGGGMRQAGMLAAAASYALDRHFEKLEEDHKKAKKLAETIAESPCFDIEPDHVETNIVLFKVIRGSVAQALAWFDSQGVAMIPFGDDTIRATFHFQVSDQDLDTALLAVKSYTGKQQAHT